MYTRNRNRGKYVFFLHCEVNDKVIEHGSSYEYLVATIAENLVGTKKKIRSSTSNNYSLLGGN